MLTTKLNSRSIRIFTREQCTWINLEYAKNSSPIIVKQEFVRKYNICGRQKSKYCPYHFTRVFERIKSRGIGPALYSGSQILIATHQAKQLISKEIKENPTSSIHQIARKFDFSNATTRKKFYERTDSKLSHSSFTDARNWVKTTNRPKSSLLHS